jgi:hypothetical protein
MGKLSCISQQQVDSLLLACNSCSKVLSTVGKLCCHTQAQCAVVNRDFFGTFGSAMKGNKGKLI